MDPNSSSPLLPQGKPLIPCHPAHPDTCSFLFFPWKPHFYLYMLTCPSHLNGKHVVFGEVLEGYEIVQKIEDVPKSPGDKPKAAVKITKSGELPVPEEGIHVEL